MFSTSPAVARRSLSEAKNATFSHFFRRSGKRCMGTMADNSPFREGLKSYRSQEIETGAMAFAVHDPFLPTLLLRQRLVAPIQTPALAALIVLPAPRWPFSGRTKPYSFNAAAATLQHADKRQLGAAKEPSKDWIPARSSSFRAHPGTSIHVLRIPALAHQYFYLSVSSPIFNIQLAPNTSALLLPSLPR